MSIQRRPKTIGDSPKLNPADFLKGAPDAQSYAPEPVAAFAGRMQGNQAQITLAMPSDLLAKASAAAKKLSISRAAFMKLAIARAVEGESA